MCSDCNVHYIIMVLPTVLFFWRGHTTRRNPAFRLIRDLLAWFLDRFGFSNRFGHRNIKRTWMPWNSTWRRAFSRFSTYTKIVFVSDPKSAAKRFDASKDHSDRWWHREGFSVMAPWSMLLWWPVVARCSEWRVYEFLAQRVALRA